MSNFGYLEDIKEFSSFSSLCIQAETRWRTDSPADCVKNIRSALEATLKWVYKKDNRFNIRANVNKGERPTLGSMVNNETFIVVIGKSKKDQLNYIRRNGNIAVHESPNKITPEIAVKCLENLFYFVQWVECTYHKESYKKRNFEESSIMDKITDNLTLKNVAMVASGVLATVGVVGAMFFGSKNKN